MLVALNQQGEITVLTKSIAKATLQQMRTESFFCPQCKEQLLLKAGTVKMPHFAHKAKSDCSNHFSEGESYPHLLGKSQLFEHFSARYHTQLEPYLPTLKQRPDILIHTKYAYALEFQCSRLDPYIFQKRTEGYKQHGIKSIWLLKTPNVPILEGQVLKASFNVFLQQFMQKGYLVTYNPLTAHFVYFSSVMYLQGNLFLSITRSLPVASQIIPFYAPKPVTRQQFSHLFEVYQDYRRQFLHTRLFYSRKGVNDFFLRAIYELRLNREQLPNYIGVPVRFAQGIPIFSSEWQLLLFYFLHEQQLSLATMNKATKHYFLQWARLPETQEAFLAVEAYIDLLQQLKIEHVHMKCDLAVIMDKLYAHFVAIKSKD